MSSGASVRSSRADEVVGLQLLDHKEELSSLLKFMVEHCKSERGYTTSARVLAILLVSLTNVWVKDYRSVDADEWNSEGEPRQPLSRVLSFRSVP
jgi:hypothetical protein